MIIHGWTGWIRESRSGKLLMSSVMGAAALGFIPGLGAIYNGETMKGLVHIAIFAGAIAILNADLSDSLQAFFGVGLACFICYMPIEAYRTAKLKRAIAYGAYAAPPSSAAPGKLPTPSEDSFRC